MLTCSGNAIVIVVVIYATWFHVYCNFKLSYKLSFLNYWRNVFSYIVTHQLAKTV